MGRRRLHQGDGRSPPVTCSFIYSVTSSFIYSESQGNFLQNHTIRFLTCFLYMTFSKPDYPTYLSEVTIDFLDRLLEKNPKKRLGSNYGIMEIK